MEVINWPNNNTNLCKIMLINASRESWSIVTDCIHLFDIPYSDKIISFALTYTVFYILLHRSDWIICLKYCYKRFCSFLVHLILLQVLLVLLFSSISKLNFKNFIFFLLNSSSRLNTITLIRTCINDIFVHKINNFFMTVLLLL